MNRENIFRDVCQVLGLTQIDNSWTKTLGLYLGVEQIVGDDYEQRVFVACFSNPGGAGGSTASRIQSPDTTDYVECVNGGVNTYADEIQIESNSVMYITAGNNMSIDCAGDLTYNGDSAVSFTSLGAIAFTTEGGIVFSDTTTNFMQIVMTLPTVEIGLAPGQLYTQTATELGGSGTQKVICIK